MALNAATAAETWPCWACTAAILRLLLLLEVFTGKFVDSCRLTCAAAMKVAGSRAGSLYDFRERATVPLQCLQRALVVLTVNRAILPASADG